MGLGKEEYITLEERGRNLKQIVEVDGEQVFTCDWVFEQMQAQSRRIDRLNTTIKICIGVMVIVAILAILL